MEGMEIGYHGEQQMAIEKDLVSAWAFFEENIIRFASSDRLAVRLLRAASHPV